MLGIVETLKEFKIILLGYKAEVHTDHKNLVHKTFLMSFNHVMRWRLTIEEYGPEIFHILGPNNVVADALSRFLKIDGVGKKQMFSRKFKDLLVQTNDLSKECPLDVSLILKNNEEKLVYVC